MELYCHWCGAKFKTKRNKNLCPTCKYLKATANWIEFEKRRNQFRR